MNVCHCGTKRVLGKPSSRMFGGHEKDWTWYILFIWNDLQDTFLLNITVVDLLLRETVSTQCILPLCIKTVWKENVHTCVCTLCTCECLQQFWKNTQEVLIGLLLGKWLEVGGRFCPRLCKLQKFYMCLLIFPHY